MMDSYDVIVAGGSISGLLAAREIASAGFSVAVIEEDSEIGTPEHCGGLVSMQGIQDLSIIPSSSAIQNNIKYAKIFSPSKNFELNAVEQKVIVLDRRVFDKQIAFQAQKMGAEIKVKCSMRSVSQDAVSESRKCTVKTTEGDFISTYFIDARGVSSIVQRNREGILQSAQYEVYTKWIDQDTIEVKFDKDKY